MSRKLTFIRHVVAVVFQRMGRQRITSVEHKPTGNERCEKEPLTSNQHLFGLALPKVDAAKNSCKQLDIDVALVLQVAKDNTRKGRTLSRRQEATSETRILRATISAPEMPS